MIIKEYTGFLDEKAREKQRLEKLAKQTEKINAQIDKKVKKKGDK